MIVIKRLRKKSGKYLNRTSNHIPQTRQFKKKKNLRHRNNYTRNDLEKIADFTKKRGRRLSSSFFYLLLFLPNSDLEKKEPMWYALANYKTCRSSFFDATQSDNNPTRKWFKKKKKTYKIHQKIEKLRSSGLDVGSVFNLDRRDIKKKKKPGKNAQLFPERKMIKISTISVRLDNGAKINIAFFSHTNRKNNGYRISLLNNSNGALF